MKSFKKIALAVVAAMTLGTLAVAPANAAVMTVVTSTGAVSGGVTTWTPVTTGTASTSPITRVVPEDNVIGDEDVVRFVATVDTGTSVTATATNATIVAATSTTAAPVNSASGSSSLTIATGTGKDATFYVYTKTTAVGTVVITNQGTTLTYYVQGTAGKINTLAVSAPTSGAAGTKQTVTVAATDIFGNKVSGKSITGRVFGSGGTLDSTTALTGATLSDFGVAEFKVTLPTTSTRSLIEFSLTTSTDGLSADVTGLPVRTLAPYAEIAVRDLAAELKVAQDALVAEKTARAADKATADAAAVKSAADLATANATIAKLNADAVVAKAAADKALADALASAAKAKADNDAALKAVKDAFNALAAKWNAKNPKAKVTLVK